MEKSNSYLHSAHDQAHHELRKLDDFLQRSSAASSLSSEGANSSFDRNSNSSSSADEKTLLQPVQQLQQERQPPPPAPPMGEWLLIFDLRALNFYTLYCYGATAIERAEKSFESIMRENSKRNIDFLQACSLKKIPIVNNSSHSSTALP